MSQPAELLGHTLRLGTLDTEKRVVEISCEANAGTKAGSIGSGPIFESPPAKEKALIGPRNPVTT